MFEDLARATAKFDRSIRPAVLETPLVRRPEFDRPGRTFHAKLENLQRTGSFKLRGATARIQSLTAAELAAGVVTASTGNHGLAVATAAAERGASAEIYVSDTADDNKVAGIASLGARIVVESGDPVRAEMAARAAAAATGQVFISPYNDPIVVAGQGTVACELQRQLQPIDAVLVAVGGGGLISGIAATLKQNSRDVLVIGASPENSAAMLRSVAAGRIIDIEHRPTLSDGTAGGVEPESVTFESCRRLVDTWITVSEAEIESALRRYARHNDDSIEGSAAVALAALEYVDVAGNVVAIMCGGNVSRDTARVMVSDKDRG